MQPTKRDLGNGVLLAIVLADICAVVFGIDAARMVMVAIAVVAGLGWFATIPPVWGRCPWAGAQLIRDEWLPVDLGHILIGANHETRVEFAHVLGMHTPQLQLGSEHGLTLNPDKPGNWAKYSVGTTIRPIPQHN